MRVLKVALGLIALIALCVVLNRVLSVTVHAQSSSGQNFFETWCGGDRDKGTVLCLKVTKPDENIVVELHYQGHPEWLTCRGVDIDKEIVLNAICGSAVTQSIWHNASLVELHLTIENYEDTRLLYKRRPG